MSDGTNYALFVLDDSGVEWFAGAFPAEETAEAKGIVSGKNYVVKPIVLKQKRLMISD